MKICLVSNLYPPTVQGGAEIYVGRLARALAEDHEVVVVTTEPGFHLAPRREVTPEGIVVYRLAPLNVAHLTRLPHRLVAQAVFRALDLYHPQVAASLGGLLRRERPDVVHLHNWVGISLAATVTAACDGGDMRGPSRLSAAPRASLTRAVTCVVTCGSDRP